MDTYMIAYYIGLHDADVPHSDKTVINTGLSALVVIRDNRAVTHRGGVFHQCLRTSQRHGQTDDSHVLPHTNWTITIYTGLSLWPDNLV